MSLSALHTLRQIERARIRERLTRHSDKLRRALSYSMFMARQRTRPPFGDRCFERDHYCSPACLDRGRPLDDCQPSVVRLSAFPDRLEWHRLTGAPLNERREIISMPDRSF